MRILVFGNSITQGFHDTEKAGWVNRLAAYCMQQSLDTDWGVYNVIFNLGISGEDIVGIEARLASEIENRIGRKNEIPQSIFVLSAVGVNDTQVDVETGEHRTEPEVYKEKLESMIDYAEKNCAGIALVGLAPIDDTDLDPIPWHPTHAYRSEEVAKYNEIIEFVAKARSIPFISLQNVFGDRVKELTVDGIHPDTEGHQLIFERVKEALEKEGII